MKSKRPLLSSFSFTLLLFFAFASPLPAQFFHNLIAVDQGSGPEAGELSDIACLDYIAPSGTNMIAIGTSLGNTVDGVLIYNDMNGVLQLSQEVRHPSSNPVQGRAIEQLPNGDLVSAFYDLQDDASDIIRVTPSGAVVWSFRLNDFQVKDIATGQCSYSSGEGFWVCGISSNNNYFSVQGYDGTGVPVFAREYDLFNAAVSFSYTQANAITFNPNNQTISVLGEGAITAQSNTGMIYTRLSLNGTPIQSRAYLTTNTTDSYRGTSLTNFHHLNNRNLALGFEYTQGSNQYVGMSHIRPNGAPLWFNSYPGLGFFSSNFYQNTGITTDIGSLMMCGSFFEPNAATLFAYSLSVDPAGGGLFFNEYATNGIFPHVKSTFEGVALNPINNKVVMVGNFASTLTSGYWPQGPNPESFYMVGAFVEGVSECYEYNEPNMVELDPQISQLDYLDAVLANPVASPLVVQDVDHLLKTNCAFSKSGNLTGLAETKGSVHLIHSSQGEIYLEISGELSAPGRIEILDVQGRSLLQLPAQTGKVGLDREDLSTGVYFVRYELPGVASGTLKMLID